MPCFSGDAGTAVSPQNPGSSTHITSRNNSLRERHYQFGHKNGIHYNEIVEEVAEAQRVCFRLRTFIL